MLTPSGGIVYHLRALSRKFRKLAWLKSLHGDEHQDLWHPTRTAVSRQLRLFLEKNSTEVLLLVGPSAGYLIEPAIFRGLSVREIHVSDPDPIAGILFKWRFRRAGIRNIQISVDRRRDRIPFFSHLAVSDLRSQLDSLKFSDGTISKRRLSIVFWGVLGQIVLHQEAWTCNQEVGTQRTQALLNGQSWASLHDAYSVKFADRFFREIPDGADSSPSTARRFATGSNAREAERKVLASLAARNLVIGVATDHETDWIDSSAEVVTIPWIIPGLSGGARLHLCHWCEFSDDPRRHRLYF